jgi:anaerobic magnesium-protoporphyrin IX monomethyl ester cyclase
MDMEESDKCDILLVGYDKEENLGLRSIAAYLISNGVCTFIEPYDGLSKENVLKRILVSDPNIVGFSLIFQRMLTDFADLIHYLRSSGIRSHFTIGGHFPTMAFNETLEFIPELDTVIRHEGEQTLLELYKNLYMPSSWPQIKGLVYRQNGILNVNSPRPLIANLDLLPYPIRREKIPYHRGLGIVSLLASRGCYYNCSFCSICSFYGSTTGPRRRTRSPLNVVQEMKHLFDRSGARVFIFRDDDLATASAYQRKWLEEFTRGLEKEKIADKISWRISCRIDEIDEDIINNLKEAGLDFLYLGIESGNDQGLKTFNKQYKVEDIYRSIAILNKLKINFNYGFMMFDPDSNFESLQENINFLHNLCGKGKVAVRFTKMFPYIGTPIAERLKKEGRLTGTLNSPDYSYMDNRLELFEALIFSNFNNVLFSSNSLNEGLIGDLEFAAFDTHVLRKFFQGEYDIDKYNKKVLELTERFNESILGIMSKAIRIMQDSSYRDIINQYTVLDLLAKQEVLVQLRIKFELENLGPIINSQVYQNF